MVNSIISPEGDGIEGMLGGWIIPVDGSVVIGSHPLKI